MSSPRRTTPKKKSGTKGKAQSRSSRAGLTFPVGRVARLLKDGRYVQRVGKAAPVFIASVLEYLVAELIELSGSTAAEAKKKRITPRYLNLAIRGDEEFAQLLQNATISGGGVKPNILKQLKTKGKKKRSSKKSKSSKGEKKDKKKDKKKGDKKKKDKKDKKDKKEKKGKSKSKKSKAAKSEGATQEA
eukprot:TRINITY_DN2484_c0_g2_i2.p2 TRINITY_DN2484_c0_g2~~TRINITY_DN2484_c0_g2_i2.p2  ORF type:complete len:201 (+),score=65.56 TRINITY_DN2484_c0_g2_i2:41-604(+)